MRAEGAREVAEKAIRDADRLVDPHGRLRGSRAAVADDRTMPQRRSALARGRMQPMQDACELAARCVKSHRTLTPFRVQ